MAAYFFLLKIFMKKNRKTSLLHVKAIKIFQTCIQPDKKQYNNYVKNIVKTKLTISNSKTTGKTATIINILKSLSQGRETPFVSTAKFSETKNENVTETVEKTSIRFADLDNWSRCYPFVQNSS